MIVLDTHILIFDTLKPEKLSKAAKKTILHAEENHQLFCSDISLWEIAMLIAKKRLDPGTDIETFLDLMLQARGTQVLPITIEIANLAASYTGFKHADPADRIIAATTLHNHASLITNDSKLQEIKELSVIK